MSEGPVGNGVKVAGTIVDSLKTQPLILALLVFNVAFFVLWHFSASDNRERQAKMVDHMLENQSKMQEMLTRCGARGALDLPTLGEVK